MLRRRYDPYAHLTAGRHLTALRLLERTSTAAGEMPWAADLLLWALNAVDPWGSAWHYSGPGSALPDMDDLVAPDSPIAAALATHRAIILMEAHQAPETRHFGVRLLTALHAAGATHFAFEASLQLPGRGIWSRDPAATDTLERRPRSVRDRNPDAGSHPSSDERKTARGTDGVSGY